MEEGLQETLHEAGEELRASHSEGKIEETIAAVEDSDAENSSVTASVLRAMAGK